jgi:uncharacterized lipoprotein YbaY
MKFAFSRTAALALAFVSGLTFSASAQDGFNDQGGISSPLVSRCAGKFGADLRAADPAFPLLGLLGLPWYTIEKTDQTVDGDHIVAIVTGLGGRWRRRGEVVSLRYRCLINDKGEAVNFTWTDLLPERNEAPPPAMVVRGSAYRQPKQLLPPGAELRVQLFDQASQPPALITEAVVRTSWVEPIPFGLRLPPDMKLQGRKLVLDARLSLGVQTLYRLKQPLVLDSDQLQRPLDITVDAVVHSNVH